MPPQFTIVTPVLNGMPWLPACVESVASQRVEVEVEHLIFDGGSSDGSREWLLANGDLGFTSFLEPDRGQTGALIKGFARATGQYLGWLNSDDILEPSALQRVQVVFATQPDVVMVTAAALLIDPADRVIGAIPAPPVPTLDGLLCDPTNPPQPSTFFRASAYRKSGGLNGRLNMAMDVDLWLRIAAIGRVVALNDVVLSRFRIHLAAKSVSGASAAAMEDLRVRRAHGMPLRSRAMISLLRGIFLRPVTGRIRNAVRGIVYRFIAHDPRRAATRDSP